MDRGACGDPPTLEEAIFAAVGITDDQEQQAETASALMGLPCDEVLVEVKERGRALARFSTRGHRGRTGRAASVVVERRVVRRFGNDKRTGAPEHLLAFLLSKFDQQACCASHRPRASSRAPASIHFGEQPPAGAIEVHDRAGGVERPVDGELRELSLRRLVDLDRPAGLAGRRNTRWRAELAGEGPHRLIASAGGHPQPGDSPSSALPKAAA